VVTAASTWLSRIERFERIGSTNDVVREWLADGTPEVCLAVADEQTQGRGREARTWVAPAGAGLLLSLGFRPAWLPPDRTWRLAATVSLAMAEAAEAGAGLTAGTIRLKWPNDLVVEGPDGVRKLAGVLGESVGLGTDDPRVVVGIGVNVAWARDEFPAELAATMTSLGEASTGRPVDRAALLDAFLASLDERLVALRRGDFDAAGWTGRQATTGRQVSIETAGGQRERATALDVDATTGALLISGSNGPRAISSGEIVHVRLGGGV
jgi:BirA family transcriptional regulator, biotin operon repressor / biotin---[acetyl-CoA-carboxylase] ligase